MITIVFVDDGQDFLEWDIDVYADDNFTSFLEYR
jgi:hypothetical protein